MPFLGAQPALAQALSEALPVDDALVIVVVLLLRDFDVPERRQRTQHRAADPRRIFPLQRSRACVRRRRVSKRLIARMIPR